MRLFTKLFLVGILALFTSTALSEVLFAQYFSFGKNKVQYDTFDWRFIETEHFDIYYYDAKNYHLAQFAAETVESSLQDLNEIFGDQLSNRIPVILYDAHSAFTQTNIVSGMPESAIGVTDLLKNRMTQPFMGDYEAFRQTLQHELVHAYMNDVYYGGTIQGAMRGDLIFPGWFFEGIAEYLSAGWDTRTDMYMRDAILNNYLPPIEQLGGFFAYRGGQAFWYYIADQYGRPKITEIMQRIKTTRNIRLSLVQSLGINLDELSERWQEYWRQRYFPEVADRQTLSSVSTQLTGRQGRRTSHNTSPSISPRGDRIAMLKISASRPVFDVVIIDANTGQQIRTVIKGANSPIFESLNIFNAQISWSPDGSRIALASQSEGSYNLAIVDVETSRSRTIRFPSIDALNSTAWSPDGQKIAFDGNIGPYQSIFVYNLETEEFQNLTNDVFTDKEPAWGPDSETIYFASNRGNRLQPNTALAGYSAMQYDSFYETDLYRIRLGSDRIERLTNTPNWSESQPTLTRDGRLLFVSDQNGIPNIYEYDLTSRTVHPVTDLQSGVEQISVSADGTRLAFSALNHGVNDIFVIRSPFDGRMDRELTPNAWAQERDSVSLEDRVPAIRYAQQMIEARTMGNTVSSRALTQIASLRPVSDPRTEDEESEPTDTTDTDTTTVQEPQAPERIDFRNYQFGESVVRDTTLQLRDDPRLFEPEDNVTEDGLYQPKEYRLRFTPDFTYAAGNLSTFYGTAAVAFVQLTDLFGDHQLMFGSDLTFDLRNSDYLFQYGYLKNRTNVFATFFHQARNFQFFSGELLRYRTFGGTVGFQYPFNRFQRIDYGVSAIGISRDFSNIRGIGDQQLSNESSWFLYPLVSFTGDYTIPGFITPIAGRRYSIQLSGSPFIGSDNLQFGTLLGDFRQYVNLGAGYSIGLRGAGAVSFGRDSQTFFMGGMLGWINQRWSDAEIPLERLADTFFTLPATPLRGHEFNTIFGNKFTLINTEFRFPLFAAVLPGPIPILPLYNITGVAFLDVGAAWGFDIPYSRFTDSATGEPIVYYEKPASFEWKVGKKETVFLDSSTGLIREGTPQEGDVRANFVDGDILIGAGFGLRTILLGLPFRYDVGWPYERTGFGSSPIHYFSIGIDF